MTWLKVLASRYFVELISVIKDKKWLDWQVLASRYVAVW